MITVRTEDGEELFSEREGKVFSILQGLKMAGKETQDLLVGEDRVPAQEWLNNDNNKRTGERVKV